MQAGISSPKDFWAGFVYVGTGTAALWWGSEYAVGSAGRMGPGYFPRVLAGILILLGIVSLVRGLLANGPPLGAIAWKQLALILAGCITFAIALPTLGFPIALFLLCIVSAVASREFRLEWRAVCGLIVVIGACALVFVRGLGLPMPLVGSWLEPMLGALPSLPF